VSFSASCLASCILILDSPLFSLGVILGVMREHKEEPKLMAQGCRAIHMLGGRCHSAELPELEEAAACVLEAFELHPEDGAVHEGACAAVATLCERGSMVREELVEAVAMLTGSIERHRTAAVVREAARGIAALCEAAPDLKSRFGSHEMPSLMVEVLKTEEPNPNPNPP